MLRNSSALLLYSVGNQGDRNFDTEEGIMGSRFKVKGSGTVQSNPESKEKSKEKTLDKVYRLISENRKITTTELAELCGVGENSIYKTVR